MTTQVIRSLSLDDNATNRKFLTETLEQWQMQPVEAAGGRQAMSALTAADPPFGLVLLDYMMPEQDGFELAASIRKHPEFENIKLVLLTSGGQRGDADRCRAVGIDAYLLKPVPSAELLTTITAVCGGPTSGGETAPELITRYTIREDRQQLRILVAEDNPVNQKLITSLLKKNGHEVAVAENGRLAVEATEKERFELVLMDMQMPIMDGLEATAIIRERESAGDFHLPIVALTANAMKADEEKCMQAGMDAFISKPIQREQFFATIGSIIKEAPRGEDREVPMGEAPSPPAPKEMIDREQVLEKVAGDWELLREIVSLFLEDLPTQLTAISEAIAARDETALQRTAHTLKGSIANFTIGEPYEIAFGLETMGRQEDLEGAEAEYAALEKKMDEFKVALIALADSRSEK